ncbi:glycosyltransferase family 1 protein [Metabacillus niabensis]|uniref:glycosyltransferase family 1 protein n=1 Tax=Metabacillus niabensis TaxID=324854 RepID=UPI001CFA25DD|nr:glycosyltransferase family 1 protein [Metabacillus niabensis]
MIMVSNPKRVLHVVSAMNRGGAETLLMNVYRNIDRTKLQFDFISHRREACHYDYEIESLGGKVFQIASLGKVGPISYVRELKRIIEKNEYVAVHAHTDYQCGFPVLAAKLSGVEKRIAHSHSNNWGLGNSLKSKIKLRALQMLIKKNTNHYCACSKEAGQFLFGGDEIEQKRIKVLKNGIDVTRFSSQNFEDYFSVRNEIEIPNDAKILGHVGTFSESKNQIFVLKILKNLLENRKDIYTVFVGEGPLKKKIEFEAKRLQIEDNVKFLGVRSDISRLMNAFDVFLFPSIFEGFGIVTIEAQSLGIPCIVSDRVTTKTDVGVGLIKYLSIEKDNEEWLKEINNAFTLKRPTQEIITRNISELGFDIKDSIPEWLALYDIR